MFGIFLLLKSYYTTIKEVATFDGHSHYFSCKWSANRNHWFNIIIAFLISCKYYCTPLGSFMIYEMGSAPYVNPYKCPWIAFFTHSMYMTVLRCWEDNLDFLDFLGLKNNTYRKTSYFRQFSTYLYIWHLIMITGVVGSVTWHFRDVTWWRHDVTWPTRRSKKQNSIFKTASSIFIIERCLIAQMRAKT